MRTRRTSSALSARTTNEWWLVITTLFWHRHLRITRRAHSCDVARVTKFSSRPRYKIHCVIWDKLLSLTHLQSSYNRSNLAIFTTLSLFNLLDLAVPSLHLLSSTANRLLENHRSLIAYICITSSLESTSRFFRQPHQSCLESPPHPLVNPSFSSSPLSSSTTTTPSLFHSREAQNLPFQQILPILDFFHSIARCCYCCKGHDR